MHLVVSSDGAYVILLDTHPAGYIDFLVPSIGRHSDGEVVKPVSLPGASKAVLDTHPYANTHRYQKDLFAEYSQGVVQVSMDYSSALPDSELRALVGFVSPPTASPQRPVPDSPANGVKRLPGGGEIRTFQITRRRAAVAR